MVISCVLHAFKLWFGIIGLKTAVLYSHSNSRINSNPKDSLMASNSGFNYSDKFSSRARNIKAKEVLTLNQDRYRIHICTSELLTYI